VTGVDVEVGGAVDVHAGAASRDDVIDRQVVAVAGRVVDHDRPIAVPKRGQMAGAGIVRGAEPVGELVQRDSTGLGPL
jgi:hypothetical protein